ncbi:hypothetical protein C0J52_13015 [Blattella germanica]|nr:hypothetical protein C0J52_13015 [Blattella germanica]
MNSKGDKSVLEWFPATEVFQSEKTDVNDKHINTFICGTYQIQHVIASQICSGLKIWECTQDLANYILKQGMNFHSKRVLDLGCGSGILGILAMQLGAATNLSVLTSVTIPNVILNSPKRKQETSSRFFSGDWESFMHLLSEKYAANEEKYDYILTSETIYNSDNHIKLLNVFKHCLNVDGTVLLAAKTYYFGVGGGTRQFESLLAEDGTMRSIVSWKCPEGVQREILRIQFNT